MFSLLSAQPVNEFFFNGRALAATIAYHVCSVNNLYGIEILVHVREMNLPLLLPNYKDQSLAK